MPSVLNSNIITAPGTYISESTAGIVPASLSSFNRCYCIGRGAIGDYNKPTQIISLEDHQNQFGITPSDESVRLFFRNCINGLLFFCRVGAPERIDIYINVSNNEAVAGTYNLVINGTTIAYTVTIPEFGTPPTQQQLVNAIAEEINVATNISPDVKAKPGVDGLIRIEVEEIGDNLIVSAGSMPAGVTTDVRYFVHTVTLSGAAAGVWSLSINDTTVSYTAAGTPTLASIVNGLAAAIEASAIKDDVVVSNITGTGFRITSTGVIGLSVDTPVTPGGGSIAIVSDADPPLYSQFIYTLEHSFDPELDEQGFIIAPEAFQRLTSKGQRESVALIMENVASTEGYDWMAFADSGPPSEINKHDKAKREGLRYTTPRGHLAYFFPYLITVEDLLVPPSPAVAAIALRRYADQGFVQPPAGAQYPVKGVKDVAVPLVKAQQAAVNPLGINCIRYFPNQGTIVWGSRTRSANPYYRFVNTRIILNVLIGTLRHAFDTIIFTAVDGRGVLFSRIRETAYAICYRMWDGGAFFGATPQEAFFCKCDRENNPDLDLEDGIVRLDVYVVPVPTLERLLVSVVRTAIGQVEIVTRNIGA